MKHKIWINFIVVLALALGSGGIVPGEGPAAQAALIEARPNVTSDGISASGAVAIRSVTPLIPSDFSCTTATGIPQTECEALVALYNDTDGANWFNNTGWLVTNTPCYWYGISCYYPGYVGTINLTNNNLKGSIPAELGGLSGLNGLRLSSNQLSGSIPPELGGLSNLQNLYLSSNQLGGNIPPELAGLSSLQDLRLYSNQLSGSIPPELEGLSNLRILILYSNELSGSIPPQLGGLSNLWYLSLFSNQLSGSIPPELGGLSNLQYLGLNSNQLTGSIPPELAGLSNLQTLRLDHNQLSGSISPELGTLTNLGYLDLSSNQLSGGIPPELGTLTNLGYLDLSSNQLSGGIPPELAGLSNLQTLWLSSNQISGSIPPDLGGLSNLQNLYLSSNQLSGIIPPALGGLSNLQYLSLGPNQLSGSIPPELGGLSNLQYLGLNSNQLTGSIPPELAGLSNLRSLRLEINQLSGSIPPELGGLSNLLSLYLDYNQLSGSIPAELGELSNLQYLYLQANKLSGGIPPELAGLTKLKLLLLHNNALSDDIPEEITALVNLDPPNTELGYNKLTASDPNVITFLNDKDHDWAETQTVPPTDLGVSAAYLNRIDLSWTPIFYAADGGYYEVSYSDKVSGIYTVHGTTSAKTANGYSVDGLASGTSYYFRVRTFTPAHGIQQNDLWSKYTQPISGTTTVQSKVDSATTILSDVPDPSPAGQPVYVTFQVTASSGTPTGAVTVTVAGEAASCLGSLAGGAGGCEITIHDPGIYTLTAAYSGDDNFLPSSTVAEHTVVEENEVERDATATTLSDEPDPTKVGQPIYVTFEVTASSGTPTGMVTVTVAETSCTGTLADGMGACEIETGATTVEIPGTYSLLATYSGDDDFLPSSTVEQHTRVAKFDSATTILSDEPDPSQVGQPFAVAFEVAAASGTPGGMVHVQVAGEAMDCFGTLMGGTGGCEITLNVPGTYTLTASYSGDDNFLPSSAVEEHAVVEGHAEQLATIYLPLSFRDYCSDFFDDFGDPGSGWETGDDEFVRSEYLDGEYRVLTKNDEYFYVYSAPTCGRENYVVEVDARWVGAPGASYGIVFGIAGDYDQYYLFEVNTDYQDFGLWRFDGNDFYTIVPITPSWAINSGAATNRLKVTRDGQQIALEVNGMYLGTWIDGNISGMTGVGILSAPYEEEPMSDARFDNFSVSRLNGSTVTMGNTVVDPVPARNVFKPGSHRKGEVIPAIGDQKIAR